MHGHEPDGLILRLVTDALVAVGLSPAQLTPLVDPSCTRAPSALVDAAALVSGDPNLGLALAEATAIRALSPVVYLMMSGPDLGAALADLTRFAPVAVHRPTTVALVTDAQTTTLLFGPEPGGRAYTEYLAALLIRLFRYLVDDATLRPIAARFTHAQPAELASRSAIFGAQLTWAQPRNALVLSAAQARLPCVHASDTLHALHERALEAALQSELEDALLGRVRAALAARVGPDLPTMATVARAVGLSERTLQRRLGERGTSFERLLQDVRRQRTLELLARPSLSIQSVALEMGYHDASSFHRAFRAWTGLTPAVYRARLKTDTDSR